MSDTIGTLRHRYLAREISCTEVANGFLADVGDDPLCAWQAIDPEPLLAAAAELDRRDDAGREHLPLFGVPVGIKDNFDTIDLPTGYGSSVYAGHQPTRDAAVVARLRAAGALIAGKTRMTEFAWMTAAETLNPRDRARTPGGSSSGSAAAVGAGTVALATGTQTAGSVNRPASYCGVLGYKPTFGRFDRGGVKLLAPSLDTAGLFAADIEDLALAAGVLGVSQAAATRVSTQPLRLAIARTPLWGRVEPEAAEAIEHWLAAAREAGQMIDELDLPGYERLAEAQKTIQFYESARSLVLELTEHAPRLSPALRGALEQGWAITTAAYRAAQRQTGALRSAIVQRLHPYDAVLTPSASGVPPRGLPFTGDPMFCRLWTLIGTPSLSLPLVRTPLGLPVGMQLVGAPDSDLRVISSARRLLVRQ